MADRVLRRAHARGELLAQHHLGIAPRDQQVGGDGARQAEREHRPEPEDPPDREVRHRDEVGHRHAERADQADHEAERADHERLPEEQARGRHRRHQTEPERRRVHREGEQDERDREPDGERDHKDEAGEQRLARLLHRHPGHHPDRQMGLGDAESHAEDEHHDARDDHAERGDHPPGERGELTTQEREEGRGVRRRAGWQRERCDRCGGHR